MIRAYVPSTTSIRSLGPLAVPAAARLLEEQKAIASPQAAAVLLADAGTALAVVLEALLVVAGLDLLVTVALGLAITSAGAILLASAAGLLAIHLDILLIAAGLDVAVAGAIGHCPFYASLGYQPKSLRSQAGFQ